MSKTTLVTGLWDIKRDQLDEGWSRSFDHYLEKFSQLLEVEENLIIFGDSKLEKFVWDKRDSKNTQFIERSQEWFKNHFFEQIQSIRNNPNWFNQSGWLPNSTQAKLEMYNPLVMSKVFLLNDASIFDKFDSEHLYWIDAGITNTVHPGYFTHDKVLSKLPGYINKFNFICFPYKAENEIHGFTYPDINKFSGKDVKLVGRGGFFGGPKNLISEINGIYYNLMSDTLNQGYMGTEESIFSIMVYKYPELISYAEIKDNGLINKFFEDLKNDQLKIKSQSKKVNLKPINYSNVGLYVITYNSPNQFKTLIESFKQYDPDYLNKPKKFLLNNSIDKSTFEEYDKLCEEFGFEEIHQDNIGICGGRQFIAEHFDKQEELDYYLFFEDDMFFYNGSDITCKNGFVRRIKNLYRRSLDITNKENFDFLKLNYTEFFGSNDLQWSWHNVPQDTRQKYFPENPTKETNDVKAAPFLKYQNIKSYGGVAYATGEIYYCNWPQIVSREGNKKMFLETTWAHPYEQTWMSYIYQETIKDNINPGILLATPTEHDRFDFYPKSERREN